MILIKCYTPEIPIRGVSTERDYSYCIPVRETIITVFRIGEDNFWIGVYLIEKNGKKKLFPNTVFLEIKDQSLIKKIFFFGLLVWRLKRIEVFYFKNYGKCLSSNENLLLLKNRSKIKCH